MLRKLLLKLSPNRRADQAISLVTVMSDDLVKDVSGHYNLDYSIKSLQEVEKILAEAAQQTGVSGTVKELLVRRAGSYVSEVGRRHYGGDYVWDEHNDLPLLASGMPKFELRLHAYEKVAQRLYKNDPADNIPFFFAGFEQQYKQGIAGDVV